MPDMNNNKKIVKTHTNIKIKSFLLHYHWLKTLIIQYNTPLARFCNRVVLPAPSIPSIRTLISLKREQ